MTGQPVSAFSPIEAILNRCAGQHLSVVTCAVGWLGATAMFVGLVAVLGGPTVSDAYVTATSSWAVAHGSLSCAFPPQSTLEGASIAAPLYPLLSGGLAELFRIGHSLPFPTSAQLGPHCSTAVTAIDNWSVRTKSIFSTVLIGYMSWLIFAPGVVALLRSTRRMRDGLEPILLLLVAVAPPVVMCLRQYFHPQDLIAIGLAAGGLASGIRKRWLLAGALLGLAITSQQFALLILAPLLVVVPGRQRVKLAASVIVTAAVIDVPLIILTSGRAIKSIVVGTGTNSISSTLLVLLPIRGDALYAISRVTPLLLAVLLAWWALRRLGEDALQPVPLLSVIATSLSFRLLFEVNLWGYYFMAVTVMLLVLDLTRGRIRSVFLMWLVVVTVASVWGGLFNQPLSVSVPIWLWQIILVPAACAMALRPLTDTMRRYAAGTPMTSTQA